MTTKPNTQSLVDFLSQSGWLTASELKNSGFSAINIAAALEEGLIVKCGERRGTRYNVPGTEPFSQEQLQVSEELVSDVLIKLRALGRVSSAELATALGVNIKETSLALKQLVQEGKVKTFGFKRGTKYNVPDYVHQEVVKEVKEKQKAPKKSKSTTQETDTVDSQTQEVTA